MNTNVLKFDFAINNIKSDNSFFIFEGLASTFEKDLHDDVIEKGAFNDSLKKGLPTILFQHNTFEPIGITMEAKERDNGLFLKGKLPKNDTFVTGRVIPQIEIGSINSMSIGFSMSRDDFEIKDGIRFIKKLDLHEVSLVTFPANRGAKITDFKSIEIRDLESLKNKRDLESVLRDAGFSRKAAVFLSSKVEFADDPNKEILLKKLDDILKIQLKRL